MLRNERTLLIVLIFIKSALTQDSSIVGTSCKIKGTDIDGVCKIFYDCPEVETNAQNRKRPQLCGLYLYTQPIVCCTNSDIPTPNRNTDSLRHSQEKCMEYEKLSRNSVTSVSETNCTHKSVALIAHGSPAQKGEFPFMAALRYKNTDGTDVWKCGGTLISDRYILTAAHCIEDHDKGPKLVRLGDHNLKTTDEAKHRDYLIKNITPHPQYLADFPFYNDIALLELTETVEFTSTIRPACLWSNSEHNIERATVIGWGQTDTIYDPSDVLQKATLEIYNKSVCAESFKTEKHQLPNGITDDMICAGDTKTMKDACPGDSGGPLLAEHENPCIYYVFGITSFGKGCGTIANGYTRVSEYNDWIVNTVWK